MAIRIHHCVREKLPRGEVADGYAHGRGNDAKVPALCVNWVAVRSGMHRCGIPPGGYRPRLMRCPGLKIGVATDVR